MKDSSNKPDIGQITNFRNLLIVSIFLLKLKLVNCQVRNLLTTSQYENPLAIPFTFTASLNTKFLFTLIKTPLIPLLAPNQTVFVLYNL